MLDSSIFAASSVCIVGNVNRDIKVTGLHSSPAIFEDGETPVSAIVETIGGGGANSACAAAALGAKTTFAGKVGADSLGDHLAEVMRRHGVDVRVARDAGCATGNTVALGFEGGSRHFVSCLPNNESLTWEDIDPSVMDGCTHLLRADVWFSESMLGGGNERLFGEARRRGLATSLDINWDPRWTVARPAEIAARKQQLRSVLPLVDVAHGNVRELATFADCSDLESALRQITRWGCRTAVVHMGSQGAGYYNDGRLVVEKPIPAGHVQHTTGTGDVLSICMILLHQRSDMTAGQKLRLANTVVCEFMQGQRNLIPSL